MTASEHNRSTSPPVHILVAEDSPLNLQVALKQLEKLGFSADGVPDGAKALEALRRKSYDIILMDCQMPELSGYEATWQIRNTMENLVHDPDARPKRAYIIAMTANSCADNRERCLEAGMDDYITKPMELRALEAAIYRGLAGSAAQKDLEEVIDPVIIAGLRQLRIPGKPDPLVEVIDLFIEEAPRQIDSIAGAVLENDATSVARIFSAAASLKGSAANLGARKLAALCDEIEQTVRLWSLSDVPPLLEGARNEFSRARKALEQIKKQSTPAATAT